MSTVSDDVLSASHPSLTAMFFRQAALKGGRPFLWAKRDGRWQATSWTDAAEAVRRLAGGLGALGLEPGDRVALISENRPEWAIADFAIMAAGAITVPAYVTNTVADHLHVLNNSGARFAIVSTRALADKVMAAAWQADHPPAVIAIEAPQVSQSAGVRLISWDEAMARGEGTGAEIEARVAAASRGDTACLIYTSGTGGAPKGVVLSHGAILSNCAGAYRLLETLGLGDEVFLSFLPLSHSYEHTVGLHFPVSIGAQVYYAEGLEHLAANLTEVRPTIMTAVPRLYETLRARMLRAISREGKMKQRLFERAVELGLKRLDGARLGPVAAAENFALDVLVRAKVRSRFGGRLKALVSGGAPLPPELGRFFTALGVRILQGYGQTEAAPCISCNPPSRVRIETVGPPLDGVEVRIAEDGEILVRGEMMMGGYWNDPEATAFAIRDGWLHTGDIGEIDPDGYIRITDRKKDIIVNSGGDNVAPQRIEGFLTLETEIAQAMVHGDRRPHLVALIVPAEDFLAAWAKKRGRLAEAAAELMADPEFHQAMAGAVERVNARLSPIEKVRRFALTAEPFSVENGMLTPTLKIRRHAIREAYGAALEALYGDERRS